MAPEMISSALCREMIFRKSVTPHDRDHIDVCYLRCKWYIVFLLVVRYDVLSVSCSAMQYI